MLGWDATAVQVFCHQKSISVLLGCEFFSSSEYFSIFFFGWGEGLNLISKPGLSLYLFAWYRLVDEEVCDLEYTNEPVER